MTTKFATLHAGLLARKGEAVPVLPNPLMTYVDMPRPVWPAATAATASDGRPLSPSEAGIARLIRRTDDSLDGGAKETDSPRPLDVVATAKPRQPNVEDADHDHHHGAYRFSFRMSPDQRRRLRVAAAQKNLSLQQSLADALDKYLDGLCACSLKECACMARRDDDPAN